MNKRTKNFTILGIVFSALSFLCFFGPLFYFCGLAFLTGTAVITKVALISSIAVVIIMSAVAAFTKWTARSRIWIILIALFFCLDKFIVVIMSFAITQIIDEIILCPLKAHFWNKVSINRELDKRGI